MNTIKAHAVLLISYEPETTRPIDVSEIVAKYDLQHCISVELELKSDGHGGQEIHSSPLKEICTIPIPGYGKSISAAITDWFKNLVTSFSYTPLYFKKREQYADSPKVPSP